jgi:hypothetical protein
MSEVVALRQRQPTRWVLLVNNGAEPVPIFDVRSGPFELPPERA